MILSAEAKRNDQLRSESNRAKTLIKQAADIIRESNEVRYTDDVVLLKNVDGKMKSLGVFNPQTMDEDDEPVGWDLCLPIPEISSVREFHGF